MGGPEEHSTDRASGAGGSRFSRWRRSLEERTFRVDPRSAGLFRIVLGSLLIGDLFRHSVEIDYLYSNTGVLSNHEHLYRPTSQFSFSIFHAFSSREEVWVLFALGLVAHFCLLIGYRTRLFAILSLLWVTGRDARMPFVENGGYIVQNLMCFWACVLPVGKRFSVDAWRASWSRRETDLPSLNAARGLPLDRTRWSSIFGLVVLCNLAVIYLFNVLNKTGHIWRQGDAVHYVLHIDRMITGIGAFARTHVPEKLQTVADYGTLVVEMTIFLSIATPRARKYARPLAAVLMTGLHGTFGTFMRLGPFSWHLIGWTTLLWLPVHFQWLRDRYEARSKPCTLTVDPSRPFDLWLARVVVRLDHFDRVTLQEGPLGVEVLGVRTHDEREIYEALLSALPYGRWLGRLAQILTLSLASRAALFALRNPARFARFWGLTVAAGPPVKPPAPIWALASRGARVAREGFGLYMGLVFTFQLYLENKLIPKTLPPPIKEGQVLQPDERAALEFLKEMIGDRVITLKPDPPDWMAATIHYPRLFQGWGMFAPNPIQEDGILVVDGYTVDGRRMDPLTGRAPIMDIGTLEGAGLSQLRQDYGNRIRVDRNVPYREGLKDYLKRSHEISGRPSDRLIAFDVYWIRDKCPPPGSETPTNQDRVPLVTYRSEEAKTSEFAPSIPREPKVRSAENWPH